MLTLKISAHGTPYARGRGSANPTYVGKPLGSHTIPRTITEKILVHNAIQQTKIEARVLGEPYCIGAHKIRMHISAQRGLPHGGKPAPQCAEQAVLDTRPGDGVVFQANAWQGQMFPCSSIGLFFASGEETLPMPRTVPPDEAYAGRPKAIIPLQLSLEREALALARQRAISEKALGRYLTRLIYEDVARWEERARLRQVLASALLEEGSGRSMPDGPADLGQKQ